MRLIPLLLCAALLAGCTTAPVPLTTQPLGTPVLAPSVGLTACQEWHSFYDSPPQGFTPLVPEGFTLAPGTTPATVTVIVFGWACHESDEMWAGVLVVPPATYANASLAADALLLRGFTTNTSHYASYEAAGAGPLLVRATSQTTDTVNAIAGHQDAIELAGQGIDYRVTATVQASPASFTPATYRFWVANGTHAAAYLTLQHSGGLSLGAGTALFQQSGDPGAPPATAGIGHRATVDSAVARVVRL